MKQDLIIFADYGLDDAAATISVLNAHNNFNAITIVPIGGNVPTNMSFNNCFTLLNNFLCLKHKITVVDTLNNPQPSEYLAEIHGNDGMGDIFKSNPKTNDFKIIKYNQWLDTLNGNEVVLSLGPMTLVKPVMERYPLKLILMGGCINESPNFKGYEFNHCLDTEAFAYCVKFPHTAITLDTCRIPALDIRNIDVVGDGLHEQILRADQKLSITRNEQGCYVWDDIAACYLLKPERFSTKACTDKWGNTINNAIYISSEVYYK